MTSNLLTISDLQNIIETLSETPVLGINAPTGSGKTTILVEELNKQNVSVFIVEPTITAVNSISHWQSKKMGRNKIGTAAESVVNYKNTFLTKIRNRKTKVVKHKKDYEITPVVYCTSGHMELIFIDLIKYCNKHLTKSELDLTFCDILMVDEAHLQTKEIEIIMNLWKYLFNLGHKMPRLILASASLHMSSTPFSEYPEINIVTKKFKITTEYHDKNYDLNSKSMYQDLKNVIARKHLEFPYAEGSTWLVFCPGYNEIELLSSLINTIDENNIYIVPVYAEMDEIEKEKLFIPCPENKRKIIIATNVAETSITINNLSGIFDTMLEKIATTSSSGGTKLELTNISKSSAEQRKGRTGRTCKGFVYRMCTESFYDNLEQNRQSEIFRVPIYEILIKLYDINLDPKIIFPQLSQTRINKSLHVLEDLHMINNGEVSELGKFASNLSLSVKNSAVLYHWIENKFPVFPALILICMIDSYGNGYLWYPKKTKEQTREEYLAIKEAHYDRNFMIYDHVSDLGILLNIFMDILKTYDTYNLNSHELKRFCAAKSLNYKTLSDFMTSLKQTIRILVKLKYKVEMGIFNISKLLNKIQPIIQNVYKHEIYTKISKCKYLNQNDEQYYLEKDVFPKITVFYTFESSRHKSIELSTPFNYVYLEISISTPKPPEQKQSEESSDYNLSS